MTADSSDGKLMQWLSELQTGDPAPRENLLGHFGQQLQRHAHRMLHGYPALKRWVQTDDVFQNAMIRLLRALQDIQPESPQHFLSLAALQIRRELIDLARSHLGPQGHGAHHATNYMPDTDAKDSPPRCDRADLTNEPSALASWAEFHETVDSLPAEERSVFDLLWYQDMTQPEAARVLKMSERTLKRRWQSARLRLYEKLKGGLPE